MIMKELSIILLTWNSEAYIEECLYSVVDSTDGYDREIIIVDNGSTDSTFRKLAPFLSIEGVELISNKRNEGVAKARNKGIERSGGRYVWLLDIDTVINREAVSALTDYMDTHPDCGICGCKLTDSAGNVQDSCRKFPTLRYKWNNMLSSLLGKFPWMHNYKRGIDKRNQTQFYSQNRAMGKPFEVDYVIGACQMIRREVFLQTGLLDEKIFYGPEDADFCLRASRDGWQTVYLPNASIIHHYRRITNKRPFSLLTWKHAKALVYFWWKTP